MNVFPTDEKLIFIVCDDFRHEGDGKVSMFGIYGQSIEVKQDLENKNVSLMSLGIFLAFTDGFGNFQSTISLIGPDGNDLFPLEQEQPVEKIAKGWMNYALKISPFNGLIGEYKLKFKLKSNNDTKEYVRTFTIDYFTEAN